MRTLDIGGRILVGAPGVAQNAGVDTPNPDLVTAVGLNVNAVLYANDLTANARIGAATRPSDGNAALKVKEAPVLVVQSDVAPDNSDKTFTVTSNRVWHIAWVYVEYTATATVGNRLLRIHWRDSAATLIGSAKAGALQTASQDLRYLFAPGVPHETAFTQSFLYVPLPPLLVLPPLYRLQVLDENSIAPAADDMVVRVGAYQWRGSE